MGTVRLEVTSADRFALLAAIFQAGISISEVVQGEDLTVTFKVLRKDYARVCKLAAKRGETVRLIDRQGIYWTLAATRKRPVLTVGLIIFLLLILFLPTRVWFVQVEGNENVPARLILDNAENCGIVFGASRREVRSERMKNALLEAIPQLQWAGVNTQGCVAVISVRERTESSPQDEMSGVGSIVAVRDGVVTQCTVIKGNGLCKVGQVVTAGEVLISGYTDCGLTIQATQAQGEVYARTLRQMEAVMPESVELRGQILTLEKKYSLIIGKKRINLYKDSGISDSSCVKMYSEYYLTLPGGFRLPVCIVEEQWIHYDILSDSVPEDIAAQNLESFADRYLTGHMVAGQILDRQENLSQSDELYCLTGEYACLEMIGRAQNEEILPDYGKSD